MSIGAFCTREVVIADRNTGIVELARLMREHHVGDLLVVDRKGEQVIPIGILTDRDIVVELIAEEVELDSVTAGDVMSRELITGRDTDSVWDTLQRMRRKGIRRLPVVNEAGTLEGILTVDDLIELLADELAILAGITGRGHQVERKRRE